MVGYSTFSKIENDFWKARCVESKGWIVLARTFGCTRSGNQRRHSSSYSMFAPRTTPPPGGIPGWETVGRLSSIRPNCCGILRSSGRARHFAKAARPRDRAAARIHTVSFEACSSLPGLIRSAGALLSGRPINDSIRLNRVACLWCGTRNAILPPFPPIRRSCSLYEGNLDFARRQSPATKP